LTRKPGVGARTKATVEARRSQPLVQRALAAGNAAASNVFEVDGVLPQPCMAG